jgi:hypothetical protein
MLLPRYSLRTTLIGVSLCAVFFLIAGEALQGQVWAVVLSVATLSFFGMFVVHAAFYLLVYVLGKSIGVPMSPARTSHGGVQTSSDQQHPLTFDENKETP